MYRLPAARRQINIARRTSSACGLRCRAHGSVSCRRTSAASAERDAHRGVDGLGEQLRGHAQVRVLAHVEHKVLARSHPPHPRETGVPLVQLVEYGVLPEDQLGQALGTRNGLVEAAGAEEGAVARSPGSWATT